MADQATIRWLATAATDTLFGGDGDDLLLGGYDNDWLNGGNGNDQINGGPGYNSMYGQSGDDVLIAIDDDTSDYADAGDGNNTIWRNINGSAVDAVFSTSGNIKVQSVATFANDADRAL